MASAELEPLSPLVGHALIIGARLATNDIVRRVQAAHGAALFAPGDFLVGGAKVGSDDNTVRAATATLRTIGVAAVIASSFTPRFYQGAIDRGLPALVIEEVEAIKPGDRLRIDIEEHKIVNQSSGDRYIVRNLYDDNLDVLRAGGLAAYRVHVARAAGGRHQ